VSRAPAGTRVLGVDPGSRSTGWGLLGGGPTTPRLIEHGVVRLDPRLGLARRLAHLHHELERIVRRLRPGCAAVEMPFKGVNARSALQLAQGVILAVLACAEVEVVEYTPAAVKKAVTGNGRADKKQVAQMVGHLLAQALPRDTPDDLSDALAVALCHVGAQRFEAAVERAKRATPGPGARPIRRPIR